MKVVVPSNPYDAKGLMISAIRDDNPVVYMFHKGVMGLPWMAKNPRVDRPTCPRSPTRCRSARPAVAREGTDVTVVTLSLSVHHALDVGRDSWPRRASSVEVIDLRSLVPLDRETVLDSVGQDRPAARRRRGLQVLRDVRRDRRDRRRGRPGDAAGAGARGSPCPTCRSRTRRRWSTPCCPARTASRRPSGPRGLPHDRGPVPRAVEGEPDAEGVVATWFVARRRDVRGRPAHRRGAGRQGGRGGAGAARRRRAPAGQGGRRPSSRAPRSRGSTDRATGPSRTTGHPGWLLAEQRRVALYRGRSRRGSPGSHREQSMRGHPQR